MHSYSIRKLEKLSFTPLAIQVVGKSAFHGCKRIDIHSLSSRRTMKVFAAVCACIYGIPSTVKAIDDFAFSEYKDFAHTEEVYSFCTKDSNELENCLSMDVNC
eukprot:scaffold1867_cov122-Cylindrotheca_fusiformis.AAC.9